MKKTLVWIIGIVLTLAAVVFQRATGPTKPLKETVTLNGKAYELKFPRSLEIGKNSCIELPIIDENVVGTISYRVYRSKEEIVVDTMKRSEKGLIGQLPEQETAGKLEYRVVLREKNSPDNVLPYVSPTVVVRYKNSVPAIWLIPHIVFVFIAMLLAVVAGLMAIFNIGTYPKILFWCGITLFLGGFVFGMMVQKFAFGEYWTGIPFGWDLTDNKTLLAMLIVMFAIFKNDRQPSRKWTITAVLVLLLVYTIPHSVMGSERDPETGEITQNL